MIPTAPKRKNGSSRKHDGKRTKEGAAVVAEMEGVAAAEDGDGLATPDGGSVQGDSEATHSMGGAELAAINKKSEARKARKLKGELLIYVWTSNNAFVLTVSTNTFSFSFPCVEPDILFAVALNTRVYSGFLA